MRGKAAFFLVLGVSPLARAEICDGRLRRSRPADLALHFHNPRVAETLKTGVNLKSIRELSRMLLQHGAFEIPVQSGFVAAANNGDHGGNYGRYLWFRDLARTYQGLSAEARLLDWLRDSGAGAARARAEQTAQGMVALISDELLRERAFANISDPRLHERGTGYRDVIWIRRLLAPLLQKRKPTAEEREGEARWGHKQNDAIALLGHATLDAVENGDLKLEDWSKTALENFWLIAAYFVRTDYGSMPDVGAWEEGQQVRTSSVALVTSFLERLRALLNSEAPMGRLLNEQEFAGWPTHERDLILTSVRGPEFEAAVGHAKDVLRERLPEDGAREIHEEHHTRGADAALFHALMFPVRTWSLPARLNWLGQLKALERNSGHIRYKQDWFLYGPAVAAPFDAKLKLAGSLALPSDDGWRPAGSSDLEQIAHEHRAHEMDKNMSSLLKLAGPDFEAQWTMQDSMLTQIYADLFRETGDPAHLAEAKRHFTRAAAWVTGFDQLTTEGEPATPFRFPEAYSPIRRLVGGGRAEAHGAPSPLTEYLVSPNSPLNWSTAEFLVATRKLLAVLDRAH